MTTIATRLAELAHRSPDAAAIVDKDVRVTFAALDAQASAIARQLIAASGGRAGNVCLYFEDKVGAISAIVGAVRGGHAYVPLDAADPEERLRFILQDCEPVALLTEARLAERARAIVPGGCAIVDIAHAQAGGDATPLPVVDPASMAYFYYTSGSTGRPKGVGQSHRNLQFFVDAYARAVGIGEGDRISMLYKFSFAAGIGGIYRGLAMGATLCAYDMQRDGIAQLADWLDRERITVLHTFPMVFREMAKRLGPKRLFPHLRVIQLGGESVFADDIDLFRARTLEHCVLVHQLSATECGIITQNIVRHDAIVADGAVLPVGRPLEGVRVEIHRDDGSIASRDEAGEVIVFSRHVSPGYWRRPELDAAAFSVDPLQPGGRSYRSGDFARIDDAGNLHFLGRKGSRVKIRGHTVDLAEVEAALASCPDVAHGAVAAEADPAQAQSMRLVAYVEARQGVVRDPSAVRRHLAGLLPPHMLPAAIHYVGALPRTPGGKLDRKLLVQAATLPVDVTHANAPRDATEAAVAHVFEQLLKAGPNAPEDDFFLVGGDSLLAGELLARLQEAFGVHVGNLHEDATVAGIAATIRRGLAQSPALARSIPVMVPLWQTGSQPPLFIVHGRHGQAFVSPHFMQLLGNDQPVWAFQARGLDGMREPHATIEAMADEYLAELRRQRPHGPYFLGALCAGVFIVTVMARRLRELGETVLPLLLLDPPNSVFQRGYLQMSEEQFVRKMKTRRADGGSVAPVEDPAYMKALIRTVYAFERAIAMHRPSPYDGDVYMLSSSQRIQGADPTFLRQLFTGGVERLEVGSTHATALSPRNPVFASSLLRCVGLIREAARAV